MADRCPRCQKNTARKKFTRTAQVCAACRKDMKFCLTGLEERILYQAIEEIVFYELKDTMLCLPCERNHQTVAFLPPTEIGTKVAMIEHLKGNHSAIYASLDRNDYTNRLENILRTVCQGGQE